MEIYLSPFCKNGPEAKSRHFADNAERDAEMQGRVVESWLECVLTLAS